MFSIERETVCWRQACRSNSTCHDNLNCDLMKGSNAFLGVSCPVKEENKTAFDFGIFFDCLQSGIVGSTDFPQKFFFCFWWGLQNLRLVCGTWFPHPLIFMTLLAGANMTYRLFFTTSHFPTNLGNNFVFLCCSSLGQNLKTSTYVWEVCFAVFISISGLVLFSSLIGNMQASSYVTHIMCHIM